MYITRTRGRWTASLLILIGALLAGCSTNPVTGKRELGLIGEETEKKIGAQQYVPSQQMQGGQYTVDENLTRYVSEVGQKVAAVSDRPLDYEFVVLNNSVPNAWALPGGKMAINRGLLLELENEAELAAVLGHEVVHAAARHGAKGLERGMLLQGGIIATAIASGNSEYSQFAVGGAQIAAQLVNTKYGRNAELESDLYGMRYMRKAGYDPQGAVTLQEKFVKLSEGRPSDALSRLFASHPPSEERVEKNIETAASLPAGGELGRDRYQRAIAGLKAAKPAYDAFDEGRKALAEKKLDEAERFANRAIGDEPREALFYGLKGDVAMARDRENDAIQAYTQALKRDENYFKYYLGRGLAYEELGRNRLAEADLKRSTELLPTADAMNALGDIANAGGNQQQALEYWQAAAGSNSPAGKEAQGKLARLNLPNEPGKYIGVRKGTDSAGRLAVQLSNPSPVAVRNIQVTAQYRDQSGQVRQVQRIFRGTLPSGQQTVMPLGNLAVMNNDLDNLRVAVTGANLAQ